MIAKQLGRLVQAASNPTYLEMQTSQTSLLFCPFLFTASKSQLPNHGFKPLMQQGSIFATQPCTRHKCVQCLPGMCIKMLQARRSLDGIPILRKVDRLQPWHLYEFNYSIWLEFTSRTKQPCIYHIYNSYTNITYWHIGNVLCYLKKCLSWRQLWHAWLEDSPSGWWAALSWGQRPSVLRPRSKQARLVAAVGHLIIKKTPKISTKSMTINKPKKRIWSPSRWVNLFRNIWLHRPPVAFTVDGT